MLQAGRDWCGCCQGALPWEGTEEDEDWLARSAVWADPLQGHCKTFSCTHVWMHTHTQTFTHILGYTDTDTQRQTYSHTDIHTHTPCTCTHTHRHTPHTHTTHMHHTHTHTHTHAHAHTLSYLIFISHVCKQEQKFRVEFEYALYLRVSLPKTGQLCTLSFYKKICAKCRKWCLNSSFVLKTQRVLWKLVFGGVMLVTSRGPACNKGQQTHMIFYITTGSITLFERNVKI